MAQKQPNLVQNVHFWSFWAKYCHFLHILSNVRPKTNVNKVPRWVFRMWVTKLLISPVKIRIFAQKRLNLARYWHFCQALLAHLVPCWWVGCWLWRAGYISQDTNLLCVYYCYFGNLCSSAVSCPSKRSVTMMNDKTVTSARTERRSNC